MGRTLVEKVEGVGSADYVWGVNIDHSEGGRDLLSSLMRTSAAKKA